MVKFPHSKNLQAIHYEADTKVLTAYFANGSIYDYAGVPSNIPVKIEMAKSKSGALRSLVILPQMNGIVDGRPARVAVYPHTRVRGPLAKVGAPDREPAPLSRPGDPGPEEHGAPKNLRLFD